MWDESLIPACQTHIYAPFTVLVIGKYENNFTFCWVEDFLKWHPQNASSRDDVSSLVNLGLTQQFRTFGMLIAGVLPFLSRHRLVSGFTVYHVLKKSSFQNHHNFLSYRSCSMSCFLWLVRNKKVKKSHLLYAVHDHSPPSPPRWYKQSVSCIWWPNPRIYPPSTKVDDICMGILQVPKKYFKYYFISTGAPPITICKIQGNAVWNKHLQPAMRVSVKKKIL